MSEAIETSYKSVQFLKLLPVLFTLYTAERNLYGYFANIERTDGF